MRERDKTFSIHLEQPHNRELNLHDKMTLLLPFRKSSAATDSVSLRKETETKTSSGIAATTSPIVKKKRFRLLSPQNTEPEDPKTNRFREAMTRRTPRLNSATTDPPKRREKKNWFQRVFTRHSTMQRGDDRRGAASEGKRLHDNSSTPTTCGNTASDETLSHEGANDRSFTSDITFGLKTLGERQPLLLSFSSDEEKEGIHDHDEVGVSEDGKELSSQNCQDELEIVFVLDEQPNVEDADENCESDETEVKEFVPKLDRKEIISALFPKGHPDERPKRRPAAQTLSKDKLAALRQFLRQRKDAYGSVGTMVLKPTCDLESVESPERQSSAVASSASSHTTPERNSNVQDPADDVHGNREVDTRSVVVDTSDVIGMEIAWDPTWELLNASDSPVSVSRSKLRALQDADKAPSCLLGSFKEEEEEEEMSVESQDLLGALRVPSLTESTPKPECDTSFVLGFHFDPLCFSSNCVDEMEIVFEEEGMDDVFVAEDPLTFSPGTSIVNQSFDSSFVWADGENTGLDKSTERKSNVGCDDAFYAPHTVVLHNPRTCDGTDDDISDHRHDSYSSGTDASGVLEKLVGLCSKE